MFHFQRVRDIMKNDFSDISIQVSFGLLINFNGIFRLEVSNIYFLRIEYIQLLIQGPISWNHFKSPMQPSSINWNSLMSQKKPRKKSYQQICNAERPRDCYMNIFSTKKEERKKKKHLSWKIYYRDKILMNGKMF